MRFLSLVARSRSQDTTAHAQQNGRRHPASFLVRPHKRSTGHSHRNLEILYDSFMRISFQTIECHAVHNNNNNYYNYNNVFILRG